MSVHGPALFYTFPWSVGLPFCLTVPRLSSLPIPNSDMSDEPGVQFMGARSKVSKDPRSVGQLSDQAANSVQRTRREMSQEANEDSQHAWHRHFHPVHPEIVEARTTLLPPRLRRGYDFRRPVDSTASEQGVIDLTNEPETPPQPALPQDSENRTPSISRLPRFGRDIMADVVDLEDEDPDDPGEGPSSSPEVQFVRARPREYDRRNLLPLWHDTARSSSSRSYPMGTALQSPPTIRLPSLQMVHLGQTDTLILGGEDTGLDSNLPDVALGYGLSSFSMDSSSQLENRRRETYKPPSPAPPGFTRTLAEDDVAVCPNCYWELGTGEGKKQEIWVAKPCGHVCHHQVSVLVIITNSPPGVLR